MFSLPNEVGLAFQILLQLYTKNAPPFAWALHITGLGTPTHTWDPILSLVPQFHTTLTVMPVPLPSLGKLISRVRKCEGATHMILASGWDKQAGIASLVTLQSKVCHPRWLCTTTMPYGISDTLYPVCNMRPDWDNYGVLIQRPLLFDCCSTTVRKITNFTVAIKWSSQCAYTHNH